MTTHTPHQIIVREFRDIRRDYNFDPSIFNDEDEKIRRVKQVIMTEIDPVDRVLFLMYTDCGSLRKLGAHFGVSHTTLAKEIRRIKQEIIDKL